MKLKNKVFITTALGLLLATAGTGLALTSLASSNGDKNQLLNAREAARDLATAQAPARDANEIRKLLDSYKYPIPEYSPPPWTTGLFEGVDAPVHGLKVTNAWQGVLSGVKVTAYAGVDSEDLKTGRIVIISIDAPHELATLVEGYAVDPEALGALRFLSSDQPILRVARADGATFTFDLSTRTLTRS